MTYEEQCNIERLNKQIIQNIIDTVRPEDFITFYREHNQQETMAEYGLRTTKQLVKILKLFNYDFSQPKPSRFKGKQSARSHESYIAGGKKSSVTQKASWAAKSDEEKEAWAIKQSIAHLNSPTFKDKITAANRAYRASLPEEVRAQQDKARSETMRAWWEALSTEEKDAIQQNRFRNGVCYHSKSSGPNEHFGQLLTSKGISYSREFCLDHKTFDFKIGNNLIEIDPTFTHNATYFPLGNQRCINKKYHQEKSAIAEKYGYRCIHVFDWDDEQKIIDSLLARTEDTIYARSCDVQEVSKQETIDFLTKHHIQSYAKDSIRLGLYHKGVLVSIMTFGSPRYNKNYEYEIIRYCASLNIIGGADKLFKHFLVKYGPTSIISYCDLSKFTGKVYENLGFKLLRHPSPSKHWYNIRTREHYTDALLRQHGFSRLIHKKSAEEDNLAISDNRTLMIEAGFVEVYDCGQASYIWRATTT